MKYINRKTRQFIIDTPVHKSTTKTENKDGKVKENIKYVANIPTEILIFLLEKFKPFDIANDDATTYIDSMLLGKDNINKKYLSFYDPVGKDGYVEMQITDSKFTPDYGASVTVKKQVKSDSYFFTISKKIFKELADDNNFVSTFRFALDLNSDGYCFKNFVIDVKLI